MLEAENAFPMVQKQPPSGVLENFKIGSGTGMWIMRNVQEHCFCKKTHTTASNVGPLALLVSLINPFQASS